MTATRPGPPRDHNAVISRFVEACSVDDRILAGFLSGSGATGKADEHSDLDLGVITTDEAFEDVMAERGTFSRKLGRPVFLEDFGLDRIVFFVLADGTECELVFGRDGALEEIEVGPFQTLFDGDPDRCGVPLRPARSRRAARTPPPGPALVLARPLALHGSDRTRPPLVGLRPARGPPTAESGRSTSIRLRQSAIGTGPDAYPVAERASTGFLR
ncbi:MAG: nucleotidyltransferase domain-containing protein, partial [Actinomycetota bacterium]